VCQLFVVLAFNLVRVYRKKLKPNAIYTAMLKNYLKILFRNFARNKAFTLINISGLTLGITCSLIMFLIVKQDLSFNRYHSQIDQIHRIGHIDVVEGREYPQGGVPLVMPPAVKEEIVGLRDVTLVSHERYGLISVGETSGDMKHYEENPELVFIEPNFFDIFDWELKEGTLDELAQPNMVALNETLAAKYFPEESAVGRTIRLNKEIDLKVIAVLEDAPVNSDFPFGIFVSMETKKSQQPDEFNRWGSISSDNVAFVLLEDNVTPEQINEQFPDFIVRHWNEETEAGRSFVLSAMEDYHFDERFGTFSGRDTPKVLLYAYSIIGALILLIACFNFINMSTAMAVKRAKEVGMRKVLGSGRKQLVFRFLGETFVITLISILFSMAITERLLPMVINEFIGLEIPFRPFTDPVVALFLIGTLVSVSVLAGLYPAIVLSKAKPIYALKGSVSQGNGNMFLRRFLVFFQFFLCQVLIFGTVVATRQMDYFLTADMGYDQEWIIDINLADKSENARNRWKSEIANIPGVVDHAFSYKPPFSGSVSGTNAYYYDSDTSRVELQVQIKPSDHKYQETYGLELVAGEWLSESDTINQFVVNEELLKTLNVKPIDALGETMNVWGRKATVVGVVKDYHTGRLSSRIEPVMMFNNASSYRSLGIRVNAANADQVVKELEKIWYGINEEYEFDYIFLDEQIEAYYEGEKKMSQLLTVFAGVAIFIGCLGLYGLVAFIANQKAKEIGIRKVLGASVVNIMRKFSTEFVILVLVAFLFAAPLSYFGMSSWLEQYEYRIPIGPMIFLISIGASVFIALGTTSYRSMKAATANPVNSLRDD